MQVAAFSGGKDSTAMILRMAEKGEGFVCLYTPTGNELPEVSIHVRKVTDLIKRELTEVLTPGLEALMAQWNALPNSRMRWCTRVLKIEPAIEWLEANPGTTLCVGLRADEPARKGLMGDFAEYRYPLREEGWNIGQVKDYLREQRIEVPRRTDCAWCYGQRLGEWFRLWKVHPGLYRQAESWEKKTGHTFRSPSRDTWPAGLQGLRERFEAGAVPRGGYQQMSMLDAGEENVCRICTL